MTTINKQTAILITVFIVTVVTSVTTLNGAITGVNDQNNGNAPADRVNERAKSHFPVVDYEAPEDPEPNKRMERNQKSKRYDRFGLVRKQSSVDITESVFHTDWYQNIEALPVKQSHDIVIGLVRNTEAHLSNDKSGVYTEVVVEIREVLKSENDSLAHKEKLRVDRPGGFVKYPGGHKRLYHFADMNAPAVGGEYLFFLTKPDHSPNYGMLTAYELNPQGVNPLDTAAIFRAFSGMERDAFLVKVRELIHSSN